MRQDHHAYSEGLETDSLVLTCSLRSEQHMLCIEQRLRTYQLIILDTMGARDGLAFVLRGQTSFDMAARMSCSARSERGVIV